MGMTMNQDRICQDGIDLLRAVFQVWSERAEERWQGERDRLLHAVLIFLPIRSWYKQPTGLDASNTRLCIV